MAAVASKDAVLADANCGGYFQDKAAERLWVKLCRGGVEPANPKDDSTYALTFITFAQ
jgi:hypothetical protein